MRSDHMCQGFETPTEIYGYNKATRRSGTAIDTSILPLRSWPARAGARAQFGPRSASVLEIKIALIRHADILSRTRQHVSITPDHVQDVALTRGPTAHVGQLVGLLGDCLSALSRRLEMLLSGRPIPLLKLTPAIAPTLPPTRCPTSIANFCVLLSQPAIAPTQPPTRCPTSIANFCALLSQPAIAPTLPPTRCPTSIANFSRYRSNTAPDSAPNIVSFYMFNITNVEGIRAGQKPNLEEVGPFTYRKFKKKVSVWWSSKGIVSAKDHVYHQWLPELSVSDVHNTSITTLNMALIGVLATAHARVDRGLYRNIVDFTVAVLARWRDPHFNGLFQERTVHELLWGYDDLLLCRLSVVLPSGSIRTTHIELVHNMSNVNEAILSLPTTYNSGEFDMGRIWQTLSFEGGITEVKIWHGALDLKPDVCHYQNIRGLMNITIPRAVGARGKPGDAYGPPVYVSAPHFCDCDSSLSEAVSGLECVPSMHTFFVDVEPITGVPMRAHLRMMISSEMTTGSRNAIEPKLGWLDQNRTVIPIFWMDEFAYAPENVADGFKSIVYRLLHSTKLA
eukprot:gene24550-10161_t